MLDQKLSACALGKNTPYLTQYNSSLLFPISRADSREALGISSKLPFQGIDIWNAFELSWLNAKGKPLVALAEIYVPCHSPYLFESKSLKLYLHSFNQTPFESMADVQKIIQNDLTALCEASVQVFIRPAAYFKEMSIENFDGICLDDIDLEVSQYAVDKTLLQVTTERGEETLYSNLLKANCLVTNQPDWGHLQIHYQGQKIDHASLLKYIISYREHDEFHEQCIERIFLDIQERCQPEKLSVYGRYTRRGGIDLNPFRSNWEAAPRSNLRLFRQ